MNSIELQFVLQCVRVAICDERRAQLLVLIPNISDWAAVLNLAHHHGVIPLLYIHLKETVWEVLPNDAREALETAHRMNASHALSLTGELLRLVSILQAHNIFALPYKGPALAAQLYGDVAMRQYGDLDVVINKSDWAKVDSLLKNDGWEIDYQLNPIQESFFQKGYNVHSYFSSRRNTILEVHWAFAEPLYSFPALLSDLGASTGTVPIADGEVSSLSPEELLFILCFHGTKHKWERLGWLVDIAYLLHCYPQLDWQRVYALTTTFRLCRALRTMLCIVHLIKVTNLSKEVYTDAFSDPIAISVAQEIAGLLFSNPLAAEGYISNQVYLKMREDWRDRFAYYYHIIFKTIPLDWALIPFALPRFLFFLYYPARVIRLLRKYLVREDI